jgi:hypothetical protein
MTKYHGIGSYEISKKRKLHWKRWKTMRHFREKTHEEKPLETPQDSSVLVKTVVRELGLKGEG